MQVVYVHVKKRFFVIVSFGILVALGTVWYRQRTGHKVLTDSQIQTKAILAIAATAGLIYLVRRYGMRVTNWIGNILSWLSKRTMLVAYALALVPALYGINAKWLHFNIHI